jgi:PAS domain S-box-containing protein
MTEALRDSESRLRMLSEGVKDYAIYLLNPQGRVTSWNAGSRRLFGYDSAEIIGQHFSCFHSGEESQRRHPEQILQTAGEQGRAEEEAWRVRKDGSRFWANTIATAVRDDAGEVQGFTCVARDITTLKHREAEFKRTVQLYRTIAENIPNGIVAIFDRDLRYVVVDGNQALEKVGFLKEGVERKTIHELFSPEACLEIEPVYRAALAGMATVTEIPMFGHNYLVHVLPLSDGQGGVHAGIALSIDITERRLVQDQVRRLNQELEKRVSERTTQLEAVNAELETFSYTVSHDLRAPLGAMQALAEATLEDCADQLDSAGKDHVRRIVAAANRMDTLIHSLLSYSRLSRVDLELVGVALNSVVKITLCQLEAEIKERAARITVEGSLPKVIGDQFTLVQILRNLVLNGIKFVAPESKPEVRIRAETRGDQVRLWVEDSGIGIAPEHHARIFNVFERLHGIETYPGMGIGLAIVRKGVARLGGKVGLESIPGSGTKFWIELSKGEDEQ